MSLSLFLDDSSGTEDAGAAKIGLVEPDIVFYYARK